MEEIEKRFEIIRAAIELSDYEAIDIQIRRLGNLSTDKHLHDILHELDSKNFRQALYDMRNYSTSLKDDFFGSSLSDTQKNDIKENKTAYENANENEEFKTNQDNNLFDLATDSVDESGAEDKEHTITAEEMHRITKESATSPRKYDGVENLTENSVTKNRLDEGVLSDDPLFSLDQEPDSLREAEPTIEKTHQVDAVVNEESVATIGGEEIFSVFDPDTLFADDILVVEEDILAPPVIHEEDIPTFVSGSELNSTYGIESEPNTEEMSGEIFSLDPFDELYDGSGRIHEDDTVDTKDLPRREVGESLVADVSSYSRPNIPTKTVKSEKPKKNGTAYIPEEPIKVKRTKRAWEFEPDEDEKLYAKFAYMNQKFRNMLHQHPQKEESENGVYREVQDFINFVTANDYSESQVEAAIERYMELKKEGRSIEAAQMIIAAATTESVFAQFMLARELFKGEVLQQNYPEAFTQINYLAMEDYPEAICDLGQLYEYGIGIDKNRDHALQLYEEAAEMGIERARKHYERLKSTNPLSSFKSLTSMIFGKRG